MTGMIKGLNIVFASYALLLGGAYGWKDMIQQPNIACLFSLVSAPIWMVGAIGLYRKKPWAWYASVFGVFSKFAANLSDVAGLWGRVPVCSEYGDYLVYHSVSSVGGVCLSLLLLVALFWRHRALLTE